jgi:hypothetical protein
MVLPIKIFEIKETVNFDSIFQKLKDFNEEEHYETNGGETLSLATEVLDLKLNEDLLEGVFSKDFIRIRHYKRKAAENAVTEEAPFWIKSFNNRVFVLVLAPSVARGVKKLLTNHVANKLSTAIYNNSLTVVEVRILHETLKELHESSPQATKLIWFDDVDIPGIEKLCLAGSNLADTKLYQEYLEHGKIWYVVFEVQRRGIVVGITRNCVVTLFSKSTIDNFKNYILEDLLTLIE